MRKALKPRREPYWGAPLARGQHLGLRVIDPDRMTWIVRRRDDTTGKQTYKSLGWLTATLDHEAARTAALAWFKSISLGVSDEPVTVEKACRDYVDERRGQKQGRTVRDSETRFERTVYGKPFGAIPIHKLRTPQIVAWRVAMGVSAANADRTWRVVRAALNLAVRERRVPESQRREWSEVKRLPVANARRDLFLDLEQRRALLAAAPDSVRDLIEAAILTGARAGELLQAKRKQYAGHTHTMTFIGKTGRRDVPLSAAAVALFDRVSKSKAQDAPLFPSPTGGHWTGFNYCEPVAEAVKAAGLPDGTIMYTLRHSFITECLAGGLSTLDVCRLVGTSLQMVEKHYGHLVMSAARERLAKVALL